MSYAFARSGRFPGRYVWAQVARAAHFLAPLGLDTRITGLAFGQDGFKIRTSPIREKWTTPEDRALSAGPSPLFTFCTSRALIAGRDLKIDGTD